jgi:uncharacterized protein (TIGR03437 family)
MILACASTIAVQTAGAAPVIGNVGNPYRLGAVDSVHLGVAPGALLGIYGHRLGPSDVVESPQAPDLELGGVSVSLDIGDRSYSLPVLLASEGKVVALVPQDAPAGDASVTLRYAGESSNPAPIRIVHYTFGILTVLNIGAGQAFASNVTGDTTTLNTLLEPARPGQQVILYGTGLGVDGITPTVWIGNSQATVLSFGPTGSYPGVEQIQIVIPEGIEGCYVPVAVQMGNTISNFASLGIASGDGACSDPLSYTREQLEQIRSLSKVRVGVINIDTGVAQAKFVEYDRDTLLSSVSMFGMPPFGTCTVNVQSLHPFITQDQAPMDSRFMADPPGITGRLLDVGQALGVSRDQSPLVLFLMRANVPGLYYGSPPRGVGVYGLTEVFGTGVDVQSMSAKQNVPLEWPLSASRWDSQHWVPGEPSPEITWFFSDDGPKYSQIYSEIHQTSSHVLVCPVAPGVRKFQVPGFVTLALALRNDQDGSTYIPSGGGVGALALPARFSAEGLDLGVFFARAAYLGF